MTNTIDTLDDLRDDADVLLQQAERAQRRLQAVSGSGGSDQVVVTFDPAGELSAVQVGFAWSHALRAADLPAAVLEAWTAASLTRLEQWAQAYEEVEREPAPAPRPADLDPSAGSVVDAVRARIRDAAGAPEAAGRYVEEILDRIDAGLDEANRLLDAHAGRDHVGRSQARHVQAHVLGSGSLTSVEYDTRWLSGAHPANIGRETTQAIADAIRSSRERGLAAALRAGELSRLARELMTPLSTTDHPTYS